jgi:hypothetical protein
MKDPDYSTAPYYYRHCFNQRCAKCEACLRYQAAQHCASRRETIFVINPALIPADTDACPHFHPIRRVRVAWGVRQIVDNIPFKDAKEIKKDIIDHFGEGGFYRRQRKESGLTPKDQDAIRKFFHRKGYTEEPVYEYYTDDFDWD